MTTQGYLYTYMYNAAMPVLSRKLVQYGVKQNRLTFEIAEASKPESADLTVTYMQQAHLYIEICHHSYNSGCYIYKWGKLREYLSYVPTAASHPGPVFPHRRENVVLQ